MSVIQHLRTGLTPGSRRALIASMLGTLVEWYDYALYGAAASLIIGPLFFSHMETGQTVAAFATFAVGFIARPLGDLLIGQIGDRRGRKPAMLLTILIMAVSTVGIGLLPTAQTWGIWAVVALIFLRLLQGLGAGAELTGAMTLVAEYTPVQRRGLWTSLVLSMPAAGSMIAMLSFLAVSHLPTESFTGWGWRLPFIASAVLFGVAIYMRNKLEESPEYRLAMEHQENKSAQSAPIREVLQKDWRNVVLGFMAVTGHNANNYIISIASLSVMTQYGGMDRSSALTAVMLATTLAVFLSPVGGHLADKFGAGKVMGIGALIGLVHAYPLFWAFTSGNFWLILAALMVSYGVVMATTSGPQGAFVANLFPVRTRFTGTALAREFSGALVAGFTPMIVALLFRVGNGSIILPATYMTCCFGVTVAGMVIARGKGDNAAAAKLLNN